MKKKKTKKILPALAASVFLLTLILLISLLQTLNRQKVALGVKVADFGVGGITADQARQKIEGEWEEFAQKEITLIYQNISYQTNLNSMGFQIDSQATVENAYQTGRAKNYLGNVTEQLLALTGHYNFAPKYQVSAQTFEQETAELFKDIEQPAKDAALIYDSDADNFTVSSSSPGNIIDRKKLLADLNKNARTFSNNQIRLASINDSPTILENETGLAAEKAKKIIAAGPYYLIYENKKWVIDQETVADWLIFEPVSECEFTDSALESACDSDNEILGIKLSRDKIDAYLTQVSATINHDTANAVLKVEDKRAVEFNPGQNGFELKVDKTVAALEENLFSQNPKSEIRAIAGTALPKIQLKDTNDLGINTLIGQGTSSFAGSPKNRIHNIKIGTAKLNGTILSPGEEFSFLGLIGAVDETQGYLPELVIKNKSVIPEFGGGLCQVSTTVFRAAVNSGLKITERRPHAFPVQYYNPQGFDATVYDPSPDLKFINDTPSNLLIESYVSGNALFFNFYGTSDGRGIAIKGPFILSQGEDGSMKTNLIQEIKRPDGQTETIQFYSSYRSPALYEPTPTPEPTPTSTPAETPGT